MPISQTFLHQQKNNIFLRFDQKSWKSVKSLKPKNAIQERNQRA